MKPQKIVFALAALLLASCAVAQNRLPDSMAKEEKRLSKFLPGGTKDSADDIGEDLARSLRDGKANDRDLLGELSRRVQKMRGRTRTTTETDVISARALATALRYQDKDIKEASKDRDETSSLRRKLLSGQDAIAKRARQLGFSVRDYKAQPLDKPSGWPMNAPVYAARSGVPLVAYSKDELGQTYWNLQEQILAIDKLPVRSTGLEALTTRRSRMIDALSDLFRRTSRLSDDALRGIH